MAIYKNREVTVVGPNNTASSPETVNVTYKDGTHENVSVSLVRFTEDEKRDLIKRYPSRYNDVSTVSQEDLDAVRVGVTPPSDPSFKEMAQRRVQEQKQKELTDKNVEVAKKEADKQFEQAKTQPKPTTPVAPAPAKVTTPSRPTTPPWVK